MKKQPLVSVIIPCFNGERYLKQTIESLRYQTYQSWECILVDDGSTDGSAALYKKYALHDQRFRYSYQKNSGPSLSRNRGVEMANGEFIQFLDADDLLLPDRLQQCLETFHEHPTSDIVYSDYVLFQKGQQFLKTLPAKIPEGDVVHAMLFRLNVDFVVLMHSLMFRSELVKKYPFDPTLPFWAEDQDCWIRMALHGAQFSYRDDVLVVYRFTEKNLTSREAELIESKLRMLERYAHHPQLQKYSLEFASSLLYLRQRLVMGLFMEKAFRKGIRLFRDLWTASSVTARMKMAGWGLLMRIFSKRSIVVTRGWIIRHTPIKWGGWKHSKQWTPPKELMDLMHE